MTTKTNKLVRPVFYNKRTGQASITIPIKKCKFFKSRPKMVEVDFKKIKKVKW